MPARRFTLLPLLALLIACPDDGPSVNDAGTVTPVDDAGVVVVPDAGSAMPEDAGPAPVQIQEVSPVSGSAMGGTRVRVRGVGFAPDSIVLVGGEPGLDMLLTNERIITFRTPPGTPGPADIVVQNSLGTATSEGAFTYYDPLELHSVEPRSGSYLGGSQIRILGDGFSEETAVLVGGAAVRGLQRIDANEMTGIVPPATSPGEVDVEVINAYGRKVLPLAFRYYAPLRVNEVQPSGGDLAGGYGVTVVGEGFHDGVSVRFGASECADLIVVDATHLECQVPAGEAVGAVAVVASDAAGDYERPAAFVYTTAGDALGVHGSAPDRGSIRGGTRLAIYGHGLTNAPQRVLVGAEEATDLEVDGQRLLVTTPPGAEGVVDLTVETESGVAELRNAFQYVTPLAIRNLNPRRGPVDGGTEVRVEGAGFGEGLRAWLGGEELEGIIRDGNALTFTTPAGAGGPVELRLERGLERSRLANAFTYEAPLHLNGLHPNRGAQSGGTYVVLTGSGFSAGPVTVQFGQGAARDVRVINDNTISLRTPANLPGTVDVTVSVGGDSQTLALAFTYFDPAFINGGSHGGDVEGAVNVTVYGVLMGQMIPQEGALVYLGLESETPYFGYTNGVGQVTLSGPDIHGPQTVTAMQNMCTSATVVESEGADVTLILYCSAPPSAGGGGGGQPPALYPRLQGSVSGFSKAVFDPATLGPDEVPFAQIQLTQRNAFSSPTPKATIWEVPVDEGGQPCQGGSGNCIVIQGNDMVFADHATFDFITMPGRYALLAWAGIYNSRTEEIVELRQLGVRRGVTAVLGEIHSGLDINLEYPLEQTVNISLPDAPGQLEGKLGPNKKRVTTYIDFGGEGVYPLGETDSDSNIIVQEELPSFPGEFMTFYGGSFTRRWEPDNVTGPSCETVAQCEPGQSCVATMQGNACAGEFVYSYPYSVTLKQGVGRLDSGVTLDPILQFPEITSPVNNGLLEGGYFRWKPAETGVRPTVYQVIIINIVTNHRWDFVVPGDQRKFRLPHVPVTGNPEQPPVPGPGAYLWALQAIYIPDFDFESWTYGDLSQANRRSWTLDVELFTKNY